ncbi:MAG: hypothetical protein IPN62_14435 [Flavobacteriales bacterium]|nr:hypothetical protein [Flavobacteriales bacterium]MBP7451140.1 hypothetical protein [Flavobacteriales bacterium]HOZ40659.1 hypothetical protein [Flavobacteriales bacterium]
MILYLTYNDQPSGVYWSQVTDVVEHLNGLGHGRVRLLALVSLHGWRGSRRRIKAHSRDAIVLPMVPRMRNWRLNRWLLWVVCLLLRPKAIMARGVMATWMALRMRDSGLVKRVMFDGRGAYAAEWEEYRIIDDDDLIAQFRPLEQEAVSEADLRLAVSEALVAHWRERYGYRGDAHVVIPCTLGTEGTGRNASVPPRDGRVRLVYSGSSAGWQGFSLLEELLVPLLEGDARVDVLFLARRDKHVQALMDRFPGRVAQAWLEPAEVGPVLAIQDLGILLRESTITNKVSSPTKFAEYLAAGLPVIISSGIGDFSEAVRAHGLGVVYEPGQPLAELRSTTTEERDHVRNFARTHYTKAAHRIAYGRVLGSLLS